jgi:hypothetical protein
MKIWVAEWQDLFGRNGGMRVFFNERQAVAFLESKAFRKEHHTGMTQIDSYQVYGSRKKS